ncbi:MAG: 2-oxoacid:acceptor oxidoreductase family protein [Candidatus Bathyarchaeia archaeon]
MLHEIRWHGRAGQGVITVSRLLAQAAMNEKKHAQAFPEFGPERIGAPISGYTRIDTEPIDLHCRIYEPDIVVVLDPSLLRILNVVEGLKRGGKLVLNTKEDLSKGGGRVKPGDYDVFTIDATRICLDILGSTKALNTIMLGALIKASNLVSLDSVLSAIGERFTGPVLQKNIELINRGYSEVKGL